MSKSDVSGIKVHHSGINQPRRPFLEVLKVAGLSTIGLTAAGGFLRTRKLVAQQFFPSSATSYRLQTGETGITLEEGALCKLSDNLCASKCGFQLAETWHSRG